MSKYLKQEIKDRKNLVFKTIEHIQKNPSIAICNRKKTNIIGKNEGI